MTRLEQRFRRQAAQCTQFGSPLTGALLEGAADDVVAGGVMADLLAPHTDEPAGTVLSLRFAGALHRLVLERRAPELALHYPSVGGAAPVQAVWPAAERAAREHLTELRELITRPVQTNEVGRAAALVGALALLSGPIRLLELGSSAGLNLRCDAFAYEVTEARVIGDARSPVRLHRPWEGPFPAGAFEVVSRKGCDPGPIDPTSIEGRLTLTSYVWGDQVDRLNRLRAAFEVAGRIPATVERAGALDFLSRELAELPAGTTTVVWHSVIWQYVDPAERAAIDALLDDVGSRATAAAPLARVSLEPERVGGDQYSFRVHVQRWPGGERVHVADALGHGPPVRWTGARLNP